MFDNPDDARRALHGEFEPDLVESIVAALVPAIVLAPAENGADRLGGTRLGGTPDLPAGLDWPRSPAPEDVEAIVRRGNADAGEAMREHFARRVPYTFVAQIDLAEVAALGTVASPLPADGRLLFFYEFAVGPWETSARVARVIWDRAPRDLLKASEPPPDLAAAAYDWQVAFTKELADHGLPPPEDDDNVYRLRPLPRAARTTLLLPDTHCIEIEAVPALARSRASDDAGARDLYFAYREAIDAVEGVFRDETSRWHQLLGSPKPDQDDPRYEAVSFTLFGKQHLSRDEWQEHRDQVFAEAREWRLLLQILVAEWDVAEGLVYFLIRADDLDARRFDRVVAVYQQT